MSIKTYPFWIRIKVNDINLLSFNVDIDVNDPKRMAEDTVFDACELISTGARIQEYERALEIDPDCLRAYDHAGNTETKDDYELEKWLKKKIDLRILDQTLQQYVLYSPEDIVQNGEQQTTRKRAWPRHISK